MALMATGVHGMPYRQPRSKPETYGAGYVDIFITIVPIETPLKETMKALESLIAPGQSVVREGSLTILPIWPDKLSIFWNLGTPCLIHQPKYSLFERWVEDGLLALLQEKASAVCLLAVGGRALTDRYLNGIRKIPARRAEAVSLNRQITADKLEKFAG